MKAGVLGSGSWGTAIAKILTDNGNRINWWVRNEETVRHLQQRRHNPHYLSAAYFDNQLIDLNTDINEVVRNSDVLVIAIPSAYITAAFAGLDRSALAGKKVVSAVKGLLPDSNLLLHEFLAKDFSVSIRDYFAVLGPCHAEEVASEKLSYLSFSGVDTETAARIASMFKTDYINTVINQDIIGVQYAAVLKNIYALGAGIAHGLEYGDNFLSVYIANAADEMVGFLKAASLAGPSCDQRGKANYAASVYLGDLLVTCYSLYSRNRTFGNMIGKGYSVQSAILELNMVAEGYNASRCIHAVNESLGAAIPIADTIYRILWKQLPATEGFREIEEMLE